MDVYSHIWKQHITICSIFTCQTWCANFTKLHHNSNEDLCCRTLLSTLVKNGQLPDDTNVIRRIAGTNFDRCKITIKKQHALWDHWLHIRLISWVQTIMRGYIISFVSICQEYTVVEIWIQVKGSSLNLLPHFSRCPYANPSTTRNFICSSEWSTIQTYVLNQSLYNYSSLLD